MRGGFSTDAKAWEERGSNWLTNVGGCGKKTSKNKHPEPSYVMRGRKSTHKRGRGFDGSSLLFSAWEKRGRMFARE